MRLRTCFTFLDGTEDEHIVINRESRKEHIHLVDDEDLACEIKVYPQYKISGSHGKGPVDWVIKIGNIIITITKAKKEDINQGIAQNAIQLLTSIQHNSKKRTYDTAGLQEDVMYGIVLTAVDWVIIKLVSFSSDNNSEGKVDILLSSLSPSSLPINKAILIHDDLVEPIKDLFRQIKWVFDRQIESQELLKWRITELEAENAKLRQIIEENARHDAENAEHKVRIEELEKNSVDILIENAELKAELAKLRHNFNSFNFTRPQQPQHVTNMQNSCSVGEEEISAVPQPYASHDIRDPVIDQPINRLPGNNANIKPSEKEMMISFLDEVNKKIVSDGIRQRKQNEKLAKVEPISPEKGKQVSVNKKVLRKKE
ncbi:hypothetical protein RhiirA1_503231 [Rhizophagus irregularis]|uniref:Uncharacterized protein n=1 Tax=Rhizophagus irregularis TaxID=588596 RepID=A0A2N0QWU3_9GLOM|nr:hypothetical protein RhiirA1_503231 [Rhizophagus irregularis]